jgi:hypothetical protein
MGDLEFEAEACDTLGLRRFKFRRQEGFLPPGSALAMDKARCGRNRKAKRGEP